MIYTISAVVAYTEKIKANCEEEALDIFEAKCPGNVLECGCEGVEEEDELDTFRKKYGFDF